jgi:hypothetical protein
MLPPCIFISPPLVVPGADAPTARILYFDIDTSGFVEFQHSFDGLALFKRMLEVAEHEVEARWCKRDGFLHGAFS